MRFPSLGKLLGMKGVGGTPRAYVAAFGKHPAWNDHVEDIGLDTDALVDLRRTLYIEGIGGNVDSGAWEALDERSRVDGFAHAFARLSSDSVVVGRLWSSTDGIGRTSYPFVVAADVAGLSAPDAIHVAMGHLVEAERACRAGSDRAAVIEAIRLCGDRMRAAIARPTVPDPAMSLGSLLRHPALGPRHQGVARIIYQLERDFAAYVRAGADGGGTRARSVDLRPQHIRVPSCLGDAAASLGAWASFFAEYLDPACKLMLIRRVDGTWIDAIVGNPGPAQIFCLRASPVASPLASEVPYSIEPSLAARVADWVDAHP